MARTTSNTPAETAPAKETPSEKFLRLAEARTGRALHDLTLIGNLAGEGYERTDAQVEAIITALRGRVDEVEARFKNPKGAETETFKLPTPSEDGDNS